MKIVVCLKQVPTREWQPRLDETGRGVRQQDASFEMNEPDAYALEEALRLREREGAGEVVACTAGPARASQVLREALARGADRGIHVEDDRLATADADVVATVLADAIRDERFDAILTGLQSDDQGAAQTGVILAQRLGIPHATIVMEVQLGESPRGLTDGRVMRVKRELESGWFQWVSMPLPALLTIQSGINQLRYATLKGIMAAKKKEIRKIVPASLPAAKVCVLGLSVPHKAKQTQLIAGPPADAARDLIARLRKDARVL
jgi:electron transfer flavoprotein beta subunit